ncbi:hypothetical protein BVIR_556 [Blastochloris viridis]|uniref:Uncharacterized protein n=1 Tax=Blastochloris viridis TaxID=1079 RepID=A0A0P0IX04_BLAVI|nr:hypothetical protein BVIR_556 [Blastochloris viridis]CUU44275.1 hypothetical protein BVIRIDIS_33230 [Blastochloris viridis]
MSVIIGSRTLRAAAALTAQVANADRLSWTRLRLDVGAECTAGGRGGGGGPGIRSGT